MKISRVLIILGIGGLCPRCSDINFPSPMQFYKILLLLLILIPTFGISVDIDMDKESADANKTKKHLMLFLHKDNCGYCEKMLFQLEESEINKAIKKDFILLEINRDDDETIAYQDFNGTNRQFLKALGVDFYPTMVFIDGYRDKIIYNVVGYRDSNKTISILKYISSKSYKKITLEEFRDELFFDK
ncbi:MAG: thioredoxin fold domain-containing protein [Sulfurovaceae bacterium]|nr:thioredoxin fold domain-containing protein [Sulfurovaceae bacterium]